MKPYRTYRLAYQRKPGEASYAASLEPNMGRAQRIVDSLRMEILSGGPEKSILIRQVFSTPREIYRVEIHDPCSGGYQRITLLDQDAMEDLLETDGLLERMTLEDRPVGALGLAAGEPWS